MFGAIYVGLSGLTAYSRGLQQVSGNVTNMNTLGYKAQTVSFTDLVTPGGSGGQTYSRSSGKGGSGVGLSEARRDYSQGELRQTERDLDLAVSGSGFLVLLDGDQTLYTRTGSFEVDANGYIVLAGTDHRLALLDASGQPTALSIDGARTDLPERTTRIVMADNLSTSLLKHSIGGVRVYDARGNEQVWTIEFEKPLPTSDEWTVTVKTGDGTTVDTTTLKFVGGDVDPATRELLIESADSRYSVTLEFPDTVSSASAGELHSLRAASVDGHKTGAVTAVQVNEDGQLEIVYSNERKHALGAVAIADFRDPQVLEQRGGGLLVEARDGGRQLGRTGDPQAGRVLSRRLEASNVDLAKQFGELILIQRGFQASSQIISVSNDMIQQLFGIRGQG